MTPEEIAAAPPLTSPLERRSPDGLHAVTPEGEPYVVTRGRSVYVRRPGGWGPPDTAEHLAAELARYYPDIVVTGEKNKPLSTASLRALYGRAAGTVAYTYGEGRYDYASETLYLQIRPPTWPVPTYSAEADEYLDTAAGAAAEVLRDWLATAWRVTEPTSLLLLTGPPHAGKSTIARAIAAPWGAATDLEGALGDFQDGLLRSPILVADEGLAIADRARTRHLRALVTARTVEVNPKGQPRGPLIGAPRLVVGCNDRDGLRIGGEDLSSDAADAIGSRVLHVPLGAAGAAFLLAHPEIDDAAIARHTAWLAENRAVVPGRRLLVEGSGAAVVRATQAAAPLAREVYAAIVDALERGIGAPSGVVERADGAIEVLVGALVAGRRWARMPAHADVVSALLAIGAAHVASPRPRRYVVPAGALPTV